MPNVRAFRYVLAQLWHSTRVVSLITEKFPSVLGPVFSYADFAREMLTRKVCSISACHQRRGVRSCALSLPTRCSNDLVRSSKSRQRLCDIGVRAVMVKQPAERSPRIENVLTGFGSNGGMTSLAGSCFSSVGGGFAGSSGFVAAVAMATALVLVFIF